MGPRRRHARPPGQSAGTESVLLVDTTSHGLLPFYFGASELKPGIVRRFSPPSGSPDASISLVSYETAGKDNDAATGEWLTEELNRATRGMQRVLLDEMPYVWLMDMTFPTIHEARLHGVVQLGTGVSSSFDDVFFAA